MATTTPAKREPLRPRSTNAGAVPARRGPASAEKENRGPKDLAHAEQETEKKVAATEPAPPPLKPSSLQLRVVDESTTSSETAVLVGPRGRDLLPPPPASSSSYAAWDLSDSESAPASSWATLPNRYAHLPLPASSLRSTSKSGR
jgi:tubby and related proteins